MAWCHLKYFVPGIWNFDLDLGLRICQGVTRQVMVAFKCNSYDDDHFAKKSTNDPEVESRVINGITEANNKWDAETKPDDQGRKMMVSSVLAGGQIAFSFDNKHYFQDILQLLSNHRALSCPHWPLDFKLRWSLIVTLMTLRWDDYYIITALHWSNHLRLERTIAASHAIVNIVIISSKDGNSQRWSLNRRKLLWNLDAKKTTQHSMKIKLCFSWELLRGLN